MPRLAHVSDTFPSPRRLRRGSPLGRRRPILPARAATRSAVPSRRRAASQMALRQQRPVVAGMFHQPAAGFHQTLLQAGQRPFVRFFSAAPAAATGSPGCRRSRSATAAPRSSGTGGSSTASSSLPAYLPLSTAWSSRVCSRSATRPDCADSGRQNEAHAREQLAGVMLHLCHYPPGRLPTGGLVEEPVVR